MDADKLREALKEIQNNDFEVKEARRPDILQACLEYIGSPDPELRDELIYATLATWIVDKKYFDAAELEQTLETCLDEQHLGFCVGESDTKSVFTRSFSSLIIASLVRRHKETPFLSMQKIKDIKVRMLEYLSKEKDYRGLTENGWAHAVAHAADVLDELAQCEELNQGDLTDILEAIAKLATNPLSVFTSDEEERLAYAVRSVFENDKMAEDVLLGWLEQFDALARRCPDQGADEGYKCFVNLKHFLRALYFELEHRLKTEEKPEFLSCIDETLQLCYRLQTGQEGA